MTDWQRIRADVVRLFRYDDYFNKQTDSFLQTIKSFDSINIWRIALGIGFVRWGLLLAGRRHGAFLGLLVLGRTTSCPSRKTLLFLTSGVQDVEKMCVTKTVSSWEHVSVLLHPFRILLSNVWPFLVSLALNPIHWITLSKWQPVLDSCFLICEMRIPLMPSSVSQGNNCFWKAFWSS